MTGTVCLPVTTEKWVLECVLVTQLHMPRLFICLSQRDGPVGFFSGQCVSVYVGVHVCLAKIVLSVSDHGTDYEQTTLPVNRVSASSVTTVF